MWDMIVPGHLAATGCFGRYKLNPALMLTLILTLILYPWERGYDSMGYASEPYTYE